MFPFAASVDLAGNVHGLLPAARFGDGRSRPSVVLYRLAQPRLISETARATKRVRGVRWVDLAGVPRLSGFAFGPTAEAAQARHSHYRRHRFLTTYSAHPLSITTSSRLSALACSARQG